jgi:hypothetical protein
MSSFSPLGLGVLRRLLTDRSSTEYVVVQRPLQRVLAFRGRTIDDVVNSPIVKNEIYGYWKLHRDIQRRTEIVELERQWNAL